MKILIIYGTTEGQTRKIARFMEDVLQDAGHKVAISDSTDEPPSPNDYDAVLIGGSIHMHQYQSSVEHYIREHAQILNQLPGAFFTVCMAIASDDEEQHEEVRTLATAFLEKTGWQPKMTSEIAGALKYTKYNFFKRWIMKTISKKEGRTTDTSHDYEYTDWEEVKAFVLKFASE